MKSLLSSLALLVLLTACSGTISTDTPSASPAPSASTVTAAELAELVLDTAAFSETLEAIEPDTIYALYGVDAELVLDSAAYLSTGATAEECAVLIMADDAAAQIALEGFQARVEDQLEALADYQPAEISKLEKAAYGTRKAAEGTVVYLVVAQDTKSLFEAINAK